jgi:hypothetical protein
MGVEPGLLGQLDLQDGQAEPLRDRDGDGRYEWEGRDWSYAYWQVSFAESPAPRVVVCVGESGFELDERQMRMAEAEAEALARRSAAVRGMGPRGEAIPAPEYWEVVLELVYGGHPVRAAEFARAAWPFSGEALHSFMGEFKAAYRASPWYTALKDEWDAFEEGLYEN